MDAKLRQIVSKSAGTYFIVTDNSGNTANIEAESKLRLYFINSEKGPVNMLFKFAKGNKTGFKSIFGNGTRLQEKRGNFSISTCLQGLNSGPIAVVNLRSFSDVDVAGIIGLNPNILEPESKTTQYQKLFNTNTFWIPKAENIADILTEENLLNFGNVGNSDMSIIVTKAKDITALTNEGGNSLTTTSLEIDEYPGLDFDMLVKDTFVDVYIFNNTFNPATVTTNKYYGHLFNNAGYLDLQHIDDLADITEAGYVRKFTGSLIPGLQSELNEEISIDTLINANYMETGLIANINADLLEVDNKYLLDMNGIKFFNGVAKIADTSDFMLSYVVPETLTAATVVYPLVTVDQNVAPENSNIITYGCEKVSDNSFIGSFDQGLRLGDVIKTAEGITYISNVEIIDEKAVIGVSTDTFVKAKYTCEEPIEFNLAGTEIKKLNLFTENCLVKPFSLIGYKPRTEQFTDGSASRQSEILDMMISPGIVKGIKGTIGVRYVIDCFKSFVEPAYKYQYGQLMISLDEGNKFVRAIINEPFVNDLEKSLNPLFKQNPSATFDWSYLPDGGNKTYSTKLLTKFAAGSDMCFFFGIGDIVNNVHKPLGGLISNLFYQKAYPFDVLANTTGYVDGITKLEYPLDDDDRAFCERFRWNPVINFNGGNTIFGNLTGQKEVTAQQQITNSELLAYIKENLYNLAKSESFKRGTYDSYLSTETETKEFMKSLALLGIIDPDYVVICSAENNTKEISKKKIKLVHVEYTPVDVLEKVVFDLNIN